MSGQGKGPGPEVSEIKQNDNDSDASAPDLREVDEDVRLSAAVLRRLVKKLEKENSNLRITALSVSRKFRCYTQHCQEREREVNRLVAVILKKRHARRKRRRWGRQERRRGQDQVAVAESSESDVSEDLLNIVSKANVPAPTTEDILSQ